ncbi:hypothetical protein U9M48_009466, partial [Paspalum notatum var. saurae]
MKMMNLLGREEIGEGSDEDEEYPIPGEWREHGFGNPVVHYAKQQEWEYRENEVVQGAKYASSALLKEAVKLWSLSLKKEFKVVKSTQSVEVPKYNRNLTAALVANEMYGRILDAPHFEPKQIIREMELQHQYTISYAKAYRAKQKVFEMRFGTYEDSYDNLPRMLATIAQRNPGTYYDVMHFPNPEGGKYKGTILTAIGVDGNNQVLPVAFAFVENENADSWYWFLERVKANAVSSRSNVCLISDRHYGILDAIEKLKYGNGASPPLWPDVHSRWCMRHLAANFYDHFKNKDLQDLFKNLERYMSISADLSNASVLFGRTITKYMETKTIKAQIHNARLLGTRENRFEVSCRDRSRRGVRRERTVQETVIGNDATWNQELFGYGMVRAYTAPNEQKWYIPNPALKRLKGRRQTRRIRNGMDEAEAGKRPKQCTQCGAVGHNYKKCPENAFPAGMAENLPTPELLDPVVDSGHRSYMSAVEHKQLATFQCRPPKEYLELDNRWLQRLRGAGLLTFCRLVEGGPIGRHGRGRPRLMIDNSLITALVDRWRPETHTFHMPCGEMAPTLQDVSYLLGLPIARTAVGPRVVPASWKDDLGIRFAGVDRLDDLGVLEPHPNARGPAKAWLLRFKATGLHPDTDDESVRRSLEAYLLWLFGFMMFKNGTSNSVDKAVLAATYRGLCDARKKDESNARLSRLGQPCSGTWVTKVQPYVEAWDNAHQDVVHPVAPHTDW